MMAYYELCDGVLTSATGVMDNRALAYGDGFFSTIGVHGGQMLFADGHRDRLVMSSARFELAVDVDGVMAVLTELAAQMGEGILKVIITRQAQSVRGYGYTDGRAMILIKSAPSPIYDGVSFYDGIPYQPSGVAVCLSERLSKRTSRFVGLKLIGGHEQVFIHRELLCHQQGNAAISEGLVADTSGEWVSGSMSNVLYRLDKAWYTPPVHRCGVAGVMRRIMMERYDITERVLTDGDLMGIDGLVFCNAVRGVMPMTALVMDGITHELGASDWLYKTLSSNARTQDQS